MVLDLQERLALPEFCGLVIVLQRLYQLHPRLVLMHITHALLVMCVLAILVLRVLLDVVHSYIFMVQQWSFISAVCSNVVHWVDCRHKSHQKVSSSSSNSTSSA
eukprot:TRINITY_DN7755_c0_g4_i2.p1 TRINITY_DN7755_c0_g4~~TRINITY_DN7755_c0_g4_i2.p1  ORF type:complete len:104 (-),score=10.27 TRINITY_DN7755_c0_g4_i2:332-643(-)